MMIIGIGTVAYFAMVYNTSVNVSGELSVNNLGLMQNRQNGIIIGVAIAVAGLACLLTHIITAGSSKAENPPPKVKVATARLFW